MQSELKRIQREIGTTFVYVTHDQEEALAMSDRIAVMNEGRVEQIGSPREIYDRPSTPFVADFIGSLNAIELVVAERVGDLAVGRYGEGERIVVAAGAAVRAGDAIRVAVRPERVRIDRPGGAAPDGRIAARRASRRGRLSRHVHAVPGRNACRARSSAIAWPTRISRATPSALRSS